jgi:PIN domain nuclease of toxin-antitoxin system
LIHLDTHVAVWLHARMFGELSDPAQTALASGSLYVSPAVVLELAFLHEIGRIASPPGVILADLESNLALAQTETPFALVAETALGMSWTRDPFDRLIVADARASGAGLVTRDRRIRQHLPEAVW